MKASTCKQASIALEGDHYSAVRLAAPNVVPPVSKLSNDAISYTEHLTSLKADYEIDRKLRKSLFSLKIWKPGKISVTKRFVTKVRRKHKKLKPVKHKRTKTLIKIQTLPIKINALFSFGCFNSVKNKTLAIHDFGSAVDKKCIGELLPCEYLVKHLPRLKKLEVEWLLFTSKILNFLLYQTIQKKGAHTV